MTFISFSNGESLILPQGTSEVLEMMRADTLIPFRTGYGTVGFFHRDHVVMIRPALSSEASWQLASPEHLT